MTFDCCGTSKRKTVHSSDKYKGMSGLGQEQRAFVPIKNIMYIADRIKFPYIHTYWPVWIAIANQILPKAIIHTQVHHSI